MTGEHTTLPLTPRPGGLFQAQSRALSAPAGLSGVRGARGATSLGDLLRGQLLVAGRDADGRVAVVTGVQLPGVLDDLYAEAADAELGLILTRTGRRWRSGRRPPARSRWSCLARPGGEPRLLPMDRDGVTGVWSATGDRSWLGRYYRYRVEVWHPAAQRIVTNSVTDPYSLALAVDSTHSLLVDLADPALTPPGWDTPGQAAGRGAGPDADRRGAPSATSRSSTSTVPAAERGTYLAFTHPTRRDAAPALARRRRPHHLHLLPAFDFAHHRRSGAPTRPSPPCDLAALPPRLAAAAARASMAVARPRRVQLGLRPAALHRRRRAAYATDPDGAARILEFRRWSQALNGAGLRVVMDVVYNHTAAAGLDRESSSTASCPATTTGSTTTAPSRTRPAARTPRPSTG